MCEKRPYRPRRIAPAITLDRGQVVLNLHDGRGKVIHKRRRRRGRLAKGLLAPLMNNFGNRISETACRRQPEGAERRRGATMKKMVWRGNWDGIYASDHRIPRL